MTSLDVICAQFKAQGHRLTPQRRAIIQVLLDERTHPTAEQIFGRVQDTMPDMAQATVYNTLRELVKMNAVVELELGLGERHYDVDVSDHAHLLCLGCGRIEDTPYDSAALAVSPEATHGFEIVDRRVIFRGYCPACALER
jgi:Fur family peroxide stress response transcriptional regulator